MRANWGFGLYNPLSLLDLLIPLAVGMLLGYLLRNRKMPKLDKLSLGVIVVLIFSLGFSIGSNNDLLAALPQVGVQALVITALSIAFSIAFVMAGKKLVKTE